MRIGELAELAAVSTRAIRHYHRVGLLPEPVREANGYRDYRLDDAVRLLRVRRLVELGLSLDEAGEALDGEHGAAHGEQDLREILTELDRALATAQERIAARRARIAALLAEPASAVTGVPADVRDRLDHTYRTQPGALERERLIAELIEPVTGDDSGQTWDAYRGLLDDPELAARIAEATRCFDELAGLPADDPAVDALAARAASLGPAVRALMPAELAHRSGDPGAAEQLFTAVTAGMSPAQARCLRLMFASWADDPSSGDRL